MAGLGCLLQFEQQVRQTDPVKGVAHLDIVEAVGIAELFSGKDDAVGASLLGQ